MNIAVNAYRIEKQRLEVTVTLASGQGFRGCIFMPACVAGHAGEPGASSLFNDPDPFFPLELDSGEVLLISKDRVMEVDGLPLSEKEEVLRSSMPMSLLEMTLVGGITHFGSMLLEVRAPGRSRVLDFLNESADRFLTLYTDQGVRLVNRTFVESVRPLD